MNIRPFKEFNTHFSLMLKRCHFVDPEKFAALTRNLLQIGCLCQTEIACKLRAVTDALHYYRMQSEKLSVVPQLKLQFQVNIPNIGSEMCAKGEEPYECVKSTKIALRHVSTRSTNGSADKHTNSVEYKLITEERFDDAIGHLRGTFFVDEPLNKAVGLCRNETGIRDLEHFMYEILEHNLSLMAVNEDDDIAGVLLNGVLHPGDTACEQEKLELLEDENFKKIMQLHYTLHLQANIFECFDVDKAFDMCILCVDSRFRGQGISQELLRRTELLARDFEFKLIKADVSGYYSEKIFKSYGFKLFSEIYYDKYVDKCGKPVLSVEAPHVKLQTMYKLLD